MKLSQNFREFIQLLNEKSVRYLVVGGYAVNLHGYPRYTKDLDFWIWTGGDNIKNLLAAISDFGFGSLGLTESDENHRTILSNFDTNLSGLTSWWK